MAANEDGPPVKVHVVNTVETTYTEPAPVEKRTVVRTYAVAQTPIEIGPISRKKIQTILTVTGANVYLCSSQTDAQQIGQGSYTGDIGDGAQLVAGIYPPILGSGQLWLVASQGTTNVSVITEYEC
jgi:hypothetical protein